MLLEAGPAFKIIGQANGDAGCKPLPRIILTFTYCQKADLAPRSPSKPAASRPRPTPKKEAGVKKEKQASDGSARGKPAAKRPPKRIAGTHAHLLHHCFATNTGLPH